MNEEGRMPMTANGNDTARRAHIRLALSLLRARNMAAHAGHRQLATACHEAAIAVEHGSEQERAAWLARLLPKGRAR